jgi:hypothetical protein
VGSLLQEADRFTPDDVEPMICDIVCDDVSGNDTSTTAAAAATTQHSQTVIAIQISHSSKKLVLPYVIPASVHLQHSKIATAMIRATCPATGSSVMKQVVFQPTSAPVPVCGNQTDCSLFNIASVDTVLGLATQTVLRCVYTSTQLITTQSASTVAAMLSTLTTAEQHQLQYRQQCRR